MRSLWLFVILPVLLLACQTTSLMPAIVMDETPAPIFVVPSPVPAPSPQVVLQRLDIEFWGLDGQKVIGSGCPGTDWQGSMENYHIRVDGVNPLKRVTYIVVTGDNSTITWEWPCSKAWALAATDLGGGVWDIFIAPSLPTETYTVMFFYYDNTFALGNVIVARK